MGKLVAIYLDGGTRTPLLCVSGDLRRFVNFHQKGSATYKSDLNILRQVGRIALLHFERKVLSGRPEVLEVLTTRECVVCLGILAGRRSELIAAGTSVGTYFKRVYRNLVDPDKKPRSQAY